MIESYTRVRKSFGYLSIAHWRGREGWFRFLTHTAIILALGQSTIRRTTRRAGRYLSRNVFQINFPWMATCCRLHPSK